MSEENWHERNKAMMKDLDWTHKDIAEKIGNTYDSERKEMQTNKPFPNRAKVAVLAYEKMKKRYEIRESINGHMISEGVNLVEKALKTLDELRKLK